MSILLGLSGSQHSENALLVARFLASALNCKIVAEHVVDTALVRWLLFNNMSEFCDRETVSESFEVICNSLQLIGESLREKYQAEYSQAGYHEQFVLDFGDPVRKLSERASHHEIVVIGHQYSCPGDHKEWVDLRGKVEPGIAIASSVPLMVVKEKNVNWQKMMILTSAEHTNPQYIRYCLSLCRILSIEPEIVSISTDDDIDEIKRIQNHLRHLIPELKNVPISMSLITGENASNLVTLWSKAEKPVKVDVDAGCLLVIPTRMSGRNRYTIFGEQVDQFVTHFEAPQILFWPEEFESEVVQSRYCKVLEAQNIERRIAS